jgi:hypothetical protein
LDFELNSLMLLLLLLLLCVISQKVIGKCE